MFKKFVFILFLTLFYQNWSLSKSTSFNKIDAKNLSRYFSGIVAFENKKNSEALNFFKSSKILINQHEPYLERYVKTLVLEDKVANAINIIRANSKKKNSVFFEAYILLALDSLKKNDIDVTKTFKKVRSLAPIRFFSAILKSIVFYFDFSNFSSLFIMPSSRCIIRLRYPMIFSS